MLALLAMLAQAIAVPAAAPLLTMSGDGNGVQPGDRILFNASLSTEQILTGADCRLLFDPAVLRLYDATDASTEYTDIALFNTDEQASGALEFSLQRFARIDRNLPNQDLARFTFDVIGAPNDATTVTLIIDQGVSGPLAWDEVTSSTNSAVYFVVNDVAEHPREFSWLDAPAESVKYESLRITAGIDTSEVLTGAQCRLSFDPSVLAFRRIYDPSTIRGDIYFTNLDDAPTGVIEFDLSRFDRFITTLPNETIAEFFFDVIGEQGAGSTVTLEIAQALGGPMGWDALDIVTAETRIEIVEATVRQEENAWLSCSGAIAYGDQLVVYAGLNTTEFFAGADCRLAYDPALLRLNRIEDPSTIDSDLLLINATDSANGDIEFSVSRLERFRQTLPNEPLARFIFDVIGLNAQNSTITLELDQTLAGPVDWAPINMVSAELAIALGAVPEIPPATGLLRCGPNISKGDILTVSADIGALDYHTGVDCRVTFDPSVLSFDDARDPERLGSGLAMFRTSSATSGVIDLSVSRLGRTSYDPLPDDPIAVLFFDVIGDAGANAALTFETRQAVGMPQTWRDVSVLTAQADLPVLPDATPPKVDCRIVTPSLALLPGEQFLLPLELKWPELRAPHAVSLSLEYDPAFINIDDARLEAGASLFEVIYTRDTENGGRGRLTIMAENARLGDELSPPTQVFEILATPLAPPPLTSPVELRCDEAWLDDGLSHPIRAISAPTSLTLELDMRSLTVVSAYGSPEPTGITYLNTGTTITASVEDLVYETSLTRALCDGWLGTGSIPANGAATTVTARLFENSTLDWQWTPQHYLTVDSERGNPQGAGWYDQGTTACWSVDSPVSDTALSRWSTQPSSGCLMIDTSTTVSVDWTREHYVITRVIPAHGGVVTPESGWFAEREQVSLDARPTTGYLFLEWLDDAAGTQSITLLVVDGPATSTAVVGLLGDVDGDDQVTTGDIARVREWILGLPLQGSRLRYERLGDVNQDGVVDIGDLNTLSGSGASLTGPTPPPIVPSGSDFDSGTFEEVAGGGVRPSVSMFLTTSVEICRPRAAPIADMSNASWPASTPRRAT